MADNDPILTALMSPGAPFEVVEQGNIRVFKNAAQNMADVLNRARAFAEAEFVVSGEGRLTYQAFFDRADGLAAHLIHDCKLAPGASIGICMQNSPAWMIGFVGTILAGGVAVLVNSRGSGQAMSRAIADTDCVIILADSKRAEKLAEAGCNIPILKDSDFPTKTIAYEGPRRQSDDAAAMMFTSGTTGTAKAAELSHRALIHGMMNTQMAMAAVFQKMAAGYGVDVETLRKQMPQSCSLLAFPLFHTSGCSAVFLTTLSMGGKLVLMGRWDGSKALDLIEKERVSTFGGVPAMYWDMFGSPDMENRDLSSLMALSCGGTALPLNLLSEMRRLFPKAFIGAGYGMTEMSGAISQANGEAFLANPKASGIILPMTDVKIVDDGGNSVATGEIGEIWTKGATLMSGYYGRPKDTEKSVADGWYKTGDIGKVDDQGYIYIVDRKTDMVISGGENIYCAEVEQILGTHPAIKMVTTFGVDDKRMGERLVAAVELSDAVDEDALIAFSNDNMASYKVPTEFVILTDPFELNAMGKIEKKKVRDMYLKRQGNGT